MAVEEDVKTYQSAANSTYLLKFQIRPDNDNECNVHLTTTNDKQLYR